MIAIGGGREEVYLVPFFRTGRAWALLAPLLASCASVGPDHQPPERAVPPEWREETREGLARGEAELEGWWRRLGDPVLDRLVDRAALEGLDLREALLRVQEARALRGVAASERWPVLDGRASYESRGVSENTPFGSFVPDSSYYLAGLDAAWEVDLWGRVRRLVEAADADLEATIEDARDVAVIVAAETASQYVRLRASQSRIAIARSNVELQEQTLGVVRARFEAGLVGERDVAQASANLANTRSRVPALEAELRAAENRLAVLLGVAPGALAELLAAPRPVPVPPVEVAVGVPADLLRRRPDVRRAERVLVAENARIGVAEAERYPQLVLAGNLGLESTKGSTFFQSSSTFFGFGPSIRWNLFDAGRRRREVEARTARAEQALVRWERAVLVALEEAENAMTSFVQEQVRRRSLVEATTQARRSLDLARTQYREGLADFVTVLVSQGALADLEDQLAVSDAAITTSLIALYKALGGGWTPAGQDPRGS